jgi:hypothetical protein
VRKALIIIGFVVLSACEKRDDFPPLLPLSAPPPPSDLTIEKTSPTLYTLDWDIVDPDSVVSFFNVYGEGFLGAEFIDSTFAPPVQIDVLVPAQGTMRFGVSSVSDQNVEGAIVWQVAPDTVTTFSR